MYHVRIHALNILAYVHIKWISSLKHSEESITVDCEIKTLDAGDFSGLSLAEECNLNKVVLNAAPLVEILQDLDNASDELELLLSPDAPYLKITTCSITVCTINVVNLCSNVMFAG